MTQARLTKTPPQFVLSQLSRELYLEFLAKARARNYSFVRFQDFLPGRPMLPQRYIALRHDIDFAPSYSLEMAELEHAAGVVGTFFVLMDGQFYNPIGTDTVQQLRRIRSLGHEIGLHFAVSSMVESDIGEEIAFRLKLLSAVVGAPVVSFSQHDPVNAGFVSANLPPGHYPTVDAARVIRDCDLLYVSDSAMMWREYTFDTALDQERNLCLLAHPHSWLYPEDDYVAMIRVFESLEVRALSNRYDVFVEALAGYYARRLNENA